MGFLFGKKKSVISDEQKAFEKAQADFFRAIYDEKLQKIDSLLALNPQLIKCRNEKGLTPLHFAIKTKKLPSLLHLLNCGADLEEKSVYETSESFVPLTVFGYACYKELKEFAFVLIERGANVKNDFADYTAHEIKLMIGRAGEIRKAYLDNKMIAPDDRDAAARKLFGAIDQRDGLVIEKIVERYPEAFGWRNAQGLCALSYAMEKDNVDMFRLIATFGADANERYESCNHRTKLIHQAVSAGKKDFVNILISINADLEQECDWDYGIRYKSTPLTIAELGNHHEIANLLRDALNERKGIKPKKLERRDIAELAPSAPQKDEATGIADKFNALSAQMAENTRLLKEALKKIEELEEKLSAPKQIRKDTGYAEIPAP